MLSSGCDIWMVKVLLRAEALRNHLGWLPRQHIFYKSLKIDKYVIINKRAETLDTSQ